MKKYIILLFLLLGSLVHIHAQTVPTNVLRIQDATTALGQNIPVGTHVYNIATQLTYVATAADNFTTTTFTIDRRNSTNQNNLNGEVRWQAIGLKS